MMVGWNRAVPDGSPRPPAAWLKTLPLTAKEALNLSGRALHLAGPLRARVVMTVQRREHHPEFGKGNDVRAHDS